MYLWGDHGMSGGRCAACATETADPFAATREAFENVLRVAGSQETQRMQHSDLERLLAEQGQQLLRQLYQDSVDRQAQAEVADEVVDAHGTQRTRKRTQQRELERPACCSASHRGRASRRYGGRGRAEAD